MLEVTMPGARAPVIGLRLAAAAAGAYGAPMHTKIILSCLVVALASGCAESSFFVKQALVAEEGCTMTVGGGVEGEDTTEFRTRGLLDIAFSHSYALPILLANRTANGIQVSGANVRIWLGGVAEGTSWEFYQPTSGYVDPEGEAGTWIIAIPDSYMANIGVTPDDPCPGDLPPIVTVGVEVLGTPTGGEEVRTPEFFFSIDLCCGCLVTCPMDSADEEGTLCMSPDDPSETPACMGQDEAFDCRLCSDVESCRWFCGY
jgi:hypothetical protein